MTALTERVALAWEDIASMRPGPRRDELAYAFRRRVGLRRAEEAHSAQEVARLRRDAELERVRAVLTYADTSDVTAHRRSLLAAADRVWHDPRHPHRRTQPHQAGAR